MDFNPQSPHKKQTNKKNMRGELARDGSVGHLDSSWIPTSPWQERVRVEWSGGGVTAHRGVFVEHGHTDLYVCYRVCL